jgi:ribonuclease HII
MGRRPDLRLRERALRKEGYVRIAGADEAGAGPLAGPLVAAAVILPPRVAFRGVDDSKALAPRERERADAHIRARALALAVEVVPARTVDEIGPYQASLRGMTCAVRRLRPAADYLLVDARRLPEIDLPQEWPVGGDGKHLAIAAASVLAKVHRDRLMVALDARFPGYGFAQHKGYATPAHLRALSRLGPCPEHRRRWAPVRALQAPTLPLG